MYVPSKNQAVGIKGNNRREIMVRTRQQRASDESSGEMHSAGQITSLHKEILLDQAAAA